MSCLGISEERDISRSMEQLGWFGLVKMDGSEDWRKQKMSLKLVYFT